MKRPKVASGKGNRPLEYSPLHQSFKDASGGFSSIFFRSEVIVFGRLRSFSDSLQ